MAEADWVEASLAGDLDRANRIQYRQSIIAARTDLPTIKEELEDFLSAKPVPPPPCPGFERLDAIMSIPKDEPEITLATFKPNFVTSWFATMDAINEETLD